MVLSQYAPPCFPHLVSMLQLMGFNRGSSTLPAPKENHGSEGCREKPLASRNLQKEQTLNLSQGKVAFSFSVARIVSFAAFPSETFAV